MIKQVGSFRIRMESSAYLFSMTKGMLGSCSVYAYWYWHEKIANATFFQPLLTHYYVIIIVIIALAVAIRTHLNWSDEWLNSTIGSALRPTECAK